MGKPTGFIEYLRELPVDRTPVERVRDWEEFHHHMDEKRLGTRPPAAWTAACRSATRAR
jgi:glutamate synthase (NADPH/NADH) small chain